LLPLRQAGAIIYSVSRKIKWPGDAAVTVSVIHLTKGEYLGAIELDGKIVEKITAFLLPKGEDTDPHTLLESSDFCFNGCDIKGQGFLFYEGDAECNSTDLMRELVQRNPHNKECIQPYIGGEEITDLPEFVPYRWAINFNTMTLEEASAWPDLLNIVREKIPLERGNKDSDLGETPWWQFWRPRIEMFRRIRGLDRVLVCSQTAKYNKFLFFVPHCVFSNYAVVVALPQYSGFCVLESQAHGLWVATFSATLEDRQRYMPSDCFDTFPLPMQFRTSGALEQAGKDFYECRAEVMKRNNEGITDTYNRFHDPEERSPDILKLRNLQATMDAAVLTAYGWEDLIPKCECKFILDYDDGEDGETESTNKRKKKKPYRFRWPDEIRDEVLARLLKLNAERAEQEKIAGEAAVAQKPKKAKTKAHKAGKSQLGLGIAATSSTELKLPTDFRLPASQPLLYTTNLVLTLLSESGGSLGWPRLLDAFVLATNPKLMQRIATADLALQAKAWAARWNETVPDGLLLPSLNQLGAKNLTLTDGNDGPVFHLLDGPRPAATEDVRYDAWLALRVAATLTPDAVQVPERAKWTKEAKKLVLA
jgi:hypothetical protein